MKPQVSGALLSRSPYRNNDICTSTTLRADLLDFYLAYIDTSVADLSFHDFDLARLNGHARREFRESDIDSTSRRSNIPNQPIIIPPVVRTSQSDTTSAHIDNEALLCGAGQLRKISGMDALLNGEEDGKGREPILSGNTPQEFGYQPMQNLNRLPGREFIRNEKNHHSGICRSPSAYKQPCSSYFGKARDQDTREIIQTGLYSEAHLPQLSVWEDHDNTVVQSPDEEHSMHPSYNASRRHGPFANPHLTGRRDAPLVYQNLHVHPSRWDSPVVQDTSCLDRRSSRNLVHADSQSSCDYDPAKQSAQLIFGNIPVSPMSRADQAASCVGQISTQARRNTASKTKAQFPTEQTPDLAVFRVFGTRSDQVHSAHDGHGERTRVQASYDSSPPRFWPRSVRGQSRYEEYRGSTSSRNLEDQFDNSYLRRPDGILHSVEDSTHLTYLASVSYQGRAGCTENELLTSLNDELQSSDAPRAALEVQGRSFSSREYSKLSPPYIERRTPMWTARNPVFVDNVNDDDDLETASFWKPHYLS